MKTNESQLWKWLAQAKKEFGQSLHMQRIENAIKRGVLDVEGCYVGGSFWAELKSIEEPKGDFVTVGLRVEQAMFMKSRAYAGGSVWLLVKMGDNLHMFTGSDAAKYLLKPCEKKLISHIDVLPAEVSPASVVRMMAASGWR